MFFFIRRSPIVKGMIIVWSGAVSAIPSGWVICDGNNGTPDLLDRSVLHADADSGGTNNVGDTSGAKTHTLTVSEMPAHIHPDAQADVVLASGGNSPSHTTNGPLATGSAGGDAAHNNRDKVYALAFIMKT